MYNWRGNGWHLLAGGWLKTGCGRPILFPFQLELFLGLFSAIQLEYFLGLVSMNLETFLSFSLVLGYCVWNANNSEQVTFIAHLVKVPLIAHLVKVTLTAHLVKVTLIAHLVKALASYPRDLEFEAFIYVVRKYFLFN